MTKNVKFTGANMIDPDDAPKLTEAWAEAAAAYRGGVLVRRGRPKKAQTKLHVSLRLDPDVVASFKASGPGWQEWINDALRKSARL